jgi:sugar lactone lactonase YvrE
VGWFLAFVAAAFAIACTRQSSEPPPLTSIRTLAGGGALAGSPSFVDPFGIAVSGEGVYVSDGETGRIWHFASDGSSKLVAENLDTPSGIALAPDGSLIVAETGAHTIKRVDTKSGQVSTVAGVENKSGFADGDHAEALFNGPIGVAVSLDGTILVTDTYNDRVRSIDVSGRVRTIAGGGEPAFVDSPSGSEARFDTPCGIAIDLDGSLIVADSGNRRLRRVGVNGAVSTIAGSGRRGSNDGSLLTASFDEPLGVAVDRDGTIWVADAGGSSIRALLFGFWSRVSTIAGGENSGLMDGPLTQSQLNRPSAVGVSPGGTLVIADTGNKLVRIAVRDGTTGGVALTSAAIEAMSPKVSDFRNHAPGRWPFDPPSKPREIAATFGEIRGEIGHGEDAWFHNGLDIPGAYGETVRLVRSERMLRPLSVEDFGGARERIRFPEIGYIHLRVGRDKDDHPFEDRRFVVSRDVREKLTRLRVRRGATFNAGDAIGVLNNQNHVHLIAGTSGYEFNALAALELPGLKDTVPPIIEKDGVQILDKAGNEFVSNQQEPPVGARESPGPEGRPITISGDVRIVLRAYDRMDGNAERRRLGLYQLGYQILQRDGTPVAGFETPQTTISFESLPDDTSTASIAYAEGSKAGATGETIFVYIVTNRVRDRFASEQYWNSSTLPSGKYVVRVFVADFFGNKTSRDVEVIVASDKR